MYENRSGHCRKKALIFAGTAEGHALAQHVYEKNMLDRADFCVATEYGAEALSDIPHLSLLEGRLNEDEMKALLQSGAYALVIDATHPYAAAVTQNIRSACASTGTEYVRLLRREGSFAGSHVQIADSIEEAVSLLNQNREKVLLTTGAKELRRYRDLVDLENRAVARVLPSAESIASCREAGIPAKHIICMQGPFSREMNIATLRQYGCRWLVTKNTGGPGGFEEKVSLGEEGFQVVIIGRPTSEEGLSFEEVLKKLEAFYGR